MKNKLGFLGLLGLLGILGFVTDNRAFIGFFGYLVFFRYFKVIPDELFIANVKKAATPAFFVSILTTTVTIAISAINKANSILSIGLLISFIISLFTFTILLTYLEFKEIRNG